MIEIDENEIVTRVLYSRLEDELVLGLACFALEDKLKAALDSCNMKLIADTYEEFKKAYEYYSEAVSKRQMCVKGASENTIVNQDPYIIERIKVLERYTATIKVCCEEISGMVLIALETLMRIRRRLANNYGIMNPDIQAQIIRMANDQNVPLEEAIRLFKEKIL